MRDFPNSAHEVRQLALKLVEFLKKNIENTHPPRSNWSRQNFNLLEMFFGKGEKGLDLDCLCMTTCSEFLWDFVAYIKERGNLLVAESEWLTDQAELEKDFEKLLYARSPLKLFMCRIRSEEETEAIRSSLEHIMRSCCIYYSPGEVFIIYCVWWALQDGINRDIAYILQLDGEPVYQPIGGEHFEIAAK
jgi:hypothetical protein